MADPTPWDAHAGWWQQHFTDGADPEYEEQIVPMVARHLRAGDRVLDVGAGEGQLARLAAAAAGGEVVGLDPSSAQLRVAVQRGGDVRYARAEAGALPCPAASFDVALACLVFEHIDPLEPAVAEVARVLRPAGRFLFFLNHPLLQAPGSGWIDDHILDEQYWRVGAYLPESIVDEELAPGVVLPFVHRPLHRYVNTLADHGLLVEQMEEPTPPPGFLARAAEYAEAVTIPRLLFLLAVKH